VTARPWCAIAVGMSSGVSRTRWVHRGNDANVSVADVLASTANLLHTNGFKGGAPYGEGSANGITPRSIARPSPISPTGWSGDEIAHATDAFSGHCEGQFIDAVIPGRAFWLVTMAPRLGIMLACEG
jgi:hypothetical protein